MLLARDVKLTSATNVRSTELENPSYAATYSKGIRFPFGISEEEPQLFQNELSNPDFIRMVFENFGVSPNKYGNFHDRYLVLTHPATETGTHFLYWDNAVELPMDEGDLAAARQAIQDGTMKSWRRKRATDGKILVINSGKVAIVPSYEPVNILLAYSVLPDLYKSFLTGKKKALLLEWLDEEDPALLEQCGMTAGRIAEIKGEKKVPARSRKKKEELPPVTLPDGKFVTKADLEKIFNGQSSTGRKWSEMERQMFLDANGRMEDRYGLAPDGMVYSPRFISGKKI